MGDVFGNSVFGGASGGSGGSVDLTPVTDRLDAIEDAPAVRVCPLDENNEPTSDENIRTGDFALGVGINPETEVAFPQLLGPRAAQTPFAQAYPGWSNLNQGAVLTAGEGEPSGTVEAYTAYLDTLTGQAYDCDVEGVWSPLGDPVGVAATVGDIPLTTPNSVHAVVPGASAAFDIYRVMLPLAYPNAFYLATTDEVATATSAPQVRVTGDDFGDPIAEDPNVRIGDSAINWSDTWVEGEWVPTLSGPKTAEGYTTMYQVAPLSVLQTVGLVRGAVSALSGKVDSASFVTIDGTAGGTLTLPTLPYNVRDVLVEDVPAGGATLSIGQPGAPLLVVVNKDAAGSLTINDFAMHSVVIPAGETRVLIPTAAALHEVVADGRGWADLVGVDRIRTPSANDPTDAALVGGIRGHQFSNTTMNEKWFDYHVPHDWVPGTAMYPHVHTVCNGTQTGVARWGFEYIVCKCGGVYSSPVTVYVETTFDGTALKEYISEVSDANAIAASLLEVDGLIKMRVFRDATHANDTMTGNVFLSTADCHYQSTGRVGTLHRTPNFYA
jgi:hypothetical protein